MTDWLKRNISIIALIACNLVPLGGVLFYGWSAFQILFLYWLESAIIGFYFVLKLIRITHLLSLVFVPFFIFHFGMFMYGHLFFLVSFFSEDPQAMPFSVIVQTIPIVWPAVVSLFLSHGVSFFVHFLEKKEYLQMQMGKDFMLGPYKRIILMHVAIIFGGWIAMLFGFPTGVLILLVALKIISDARAHVREHAPVIIASHSGLS